MWSRRLLVSIFLWMLIVATVIRNILPSKNIIFHDVRDDPSYYDDSLNNNNNNTSHSSHIPSNIQTPTKTTSSSLLGFDNGNASINVSSSTSKTNNNIRRWGCHRSESPLIFIHIGKAGGGEIRARLAAGALRYNRTKWKDPTLDDHYYPMGLSNDNKGKGKFCNSLMNQQRMPNSTLYKGNSFEGSIPCHATTPLGMAVACPQPIRKYGTGLCLGCENLTSADCYTVYVGHNKLGNELHWLPPKYLQDWWKTSPWNTNDDGNNDNNSPQSVVARALKSLEPNNTSWCLEQNQTNISRPLHTYHAVKQVYDTCSIPLATKMDALSRRLFQTTDDNDNDNQKNYNYAPVYTSLPVQRVVMLREPFSWLISKLAWHGKSSHCDNLTKAVVWAKPMCLDYVLFLCGEDCINRYELNTLSLEAMERQAAWNLRHSISVVGLLHESEQFYDMISTRVAYINMSLHPDVHGSRHKSKQSEEVKRCRTIYQNVDFQERFQQGLPILQVLNRLYQLGVEVNRFQQAELRECNVVRH
jgi:hypothetical protein